MNRKVIFGILLVAALAVSSEAFLKEKKLAKFFLLGVALAPRGFVPVPIPQYKHSYGHGHEKVEHVHVHAAHHHGHHGHHVEDHHGWH